MSASGSADRMEFEMALPWRKLGRGLAALAIVAAACASTASAAGAASSPVAGGPSGSGQCSPQAAAARNDPSPATMKTFGECEIGRRMATLQTLQTAAKASPGLTTADATRAMADIGAASAELTRLKAALDGEVTAAAMRVTIVEVVSRVRVYELVVPQVRLAMVADDVLSLEPHLGQLASDLAARITQARAAGKDVSAAQAALDAMNGALNEAESLAAPWPSRLLALTPAQYDAGTAGPVLQQARAALGSARDRLRTAVQGGRDVLARLK
jgi:hypothetical protein